MNPIFQKARRRSERLPSRSLDAQSEELLNDIITSFSPHHFFDLDQSKVTFEHSIFYRQVLSDEFETVLKDFTLFRNRINNVTVQNVATVSDIFNSLTNRLKLHLDLIYKDFHLSNWYFDHLIQIADSSLLDKAAELVEEHLRNFQQNINIWESNISDFMRLKKTWRSTKGYKVGETMFYGRTRLYRRTRISPRRVERAKITHQYKTSVMTSYFLTALSKRLNR